MTVEDVRSEDRDSTRVQLVLVLQRMTLICGRGGGSKAPLPLLPRARPRHDFSKTALKIRIGCRRGTLSVRMRPTALTTTAKGEEYVNATHRVFELENYDVKAAWHLKGVGGGNRKHAFTLAWSSVTCHTHAGSWECPPPRVDDRFRTPGGVTGPRLGRV